MNKKLSIIIIICVLVALSLLAIPLLLKKTPAKAKEPEKLKPEEKIDYVMSKDFSELPIEEKKKYLKASMQNDGPGRFFRHNDNLTEEQRKQLRENVRPVFRAMRQEQANEFFELKTDEEKIAYLDKKIDERLERREKMAEHFQNMSEEDKQKMAQRFEERRQRRGGRGRSVARIKERIESTDPKERAKATEYRMALRERMKQRNIPSFRGGRGGR